MINSNNNNNNNATNNIQQVSTCEITNEEKKLPQLPDDALAMIFRFDLPLPVLSRLSKKWYILSVNIMKGHVFPSIQSIADSIFKIMDVQDSFKEYVSSNEQSEMLTRRQKLIAILENIEIKLEPARSLLGVKAIQFGQIGEAMAILQMCAENNRSATDISLVIRIPIEKAMTMLKIESTLRQTAINDRNVFMIPKEICNKIIGFESLFLALNCETIDESICIISEKISQDQRMESFVNLSISLAKLKQFTKALLVINYFSKNEQEEYLDLLIKSFIEKGDVYELFNCILEKQDILTSKEFLIRLSRHIFLMEQKTIDMFFRVLTALIPKLNEQKFSNILHGLVISAMKNIKIAEKIMNSADIEYKKEFYSCFLSHDVLNEPKDIELKNLIYMINAIPDHVYEENQLTKGSILVKGKVREQLQTFIRELIKEKYFKELLDIADVITSSEVVENLKQAYSHTLLVLAINLAKEGYINKAKELINSISDEVGKNLVLKTCENYEKNLAICQDKLRNI